MPLNLENNRYPTKEEVLEAIPQAIHSLMSFIPGIHFRPGEPFVEFSARILEETKQWKRDIFPHWKTDSPAQKIDKLRLLALALFPLLKTRFAVPSRIDFKLSQTWGMDTEKDASIDELRLLSFVFTIHMDRENPSILSLLHEMGHIWFGTDEKLAQAFAVWVFTEVFPKSLSQLVWEGHKLVKPASRGE